LVTHTAVLAPARRPVTTLKARRQGPSAKPFLRQINGYSDPFALLPIHLRPVEARTCDRMSPSRG